MLDPLIGTQHRKYLFSLDKGRKVPLNKLNLPASLQLLLSVTRNMMEIHVSYLLQHGGDAKEILEAWVYKHFDAPFPNDHDKKLLASITGMPRSQVSL